MKKFIKLTGIILLLICLGGSIFVYGTKVSVNTLFIENQKFESDKINDDLDNLKIAFISDIHFNHFMNKERLDKMIQKINNNKPDIILFGGDIFDEPDLYPVDDKVKQEVIESLKSLNADLGKFAVLGEEDHKESVTSFISDILFQADFELINNNHLQLTKNNSSSINLIGIDSLIGGTPDIEKSFEDVDTNAYTIVLTHAPDIIGQLPSSGIDLVLAGHSHGGQIALPIIGAVNKVEGATTYSKGEYFINQTHLIVSNGLGTTKNDVRIFADPQCHIIRLTKQ